MHSNNCFWFTQQSSVRHKYKMSTTSSNPTKHHGPKSSSGKAVTSAGAHIIQVVPPHRFVRRDFQIHLTSRINLCWDMAIFLRKLFFHISKGWIESIVVPPIQLPLIIICLFLISGLKLWLPVPSGLHLSPHLSHFFAKPPLLIFLPNLPSLVLLLFAKWVASFSYSFAKPPSLVLRLCAKQCCHCYCFICSLLTQFPTDPQKGFFFDCRVCFYSSYFPPFPPPLPHYLAYSFYGSVPGKCQASLSLLSGPRRCQPPMSRGARWALPVFFCPCTLFFLGLTCLFKFRRENIELIVFMEEWQSNMRAMPACCNLSHRATHYGRVIAYRGRKRGVEKEGGDIQLPTSLTFIVCMG